MSHLEGLVCIEVQGHPGVGEEEMQSPEVEQVVAAHLPGECLHGPWILHRVQQHYLQANNVSAPSSITAWHSLYTASGG